LITEAGVIAGTLPYMSPEQVRGEALDSRTDVFSFGTMLCELVTGRRPFAAPSAAETMSAILTVDPELPRRQGAPATELELQRIIRKCINKDRSQRYQSSEDLVIDLKNVARESASTARAASDESTPARPRWVSISIVMALLVLAMVTIGAYRWAVAPGAIRSVAVLPFVDPLANSESQYQSDGIADGIIDRLSKVPDLRVTSHNAVFRYKGRDIDPQTVGRELGVEAVVMGRVDRRREGLTLSLELIDAEDSTRLWGKRYDGTLADLLSMQGEIPRDISDQLQIRISGTTRDQLTRQDTGSIEAYELYLKGRHSWLTWSQEGSRRAVEYFEEALARDPNYARAYSGLADAYIEGTGTGIPVREAHRLARDAATRALALDPTLGEAHASMAQLLLFDDWDFAGAEAALRRALDLNPNHVIGHHQYSHFLLIVGRHEESFAACRRMAELDPLSPLVPITSVITISTRGSTRRRSIRACRP
jgi:serine/threonine-protein kinase